MGELESVFKALANQRRRFALRFLQRHYSVTLADLAESVAEQECGQDAAAIADERIKNVYMTLYHTHVPVLENVRLARYEQDHDLVAKTEQTTPILEEVRDEVDQLRKIENSDRTTGRGPR